MMKNGLGACSVIYHKNQDTSDVNLPPFGPKPRSDYGISCCKCNAGIPFRKFTKVTSLYTGIDTLTVVAYTWHHNLTDYLSQVLSVHLLHFPCMRNKQRDRSTHVLQVPLYTPCMLQ